MSRVKIWFGLVFALLAVTALGSVEPAQQELYKTQRDELLAAASDLGLPNGTVKADQPFLYFHVGPVRMDFFALSVAKTTPEEFANIADEAIKQGFGEEHKIVFATERSQLVLDSDHDHSRWFMNSSTQAVDFEKIRAVFEAKGMHPLILVRTGQNDIITGNNTEPKQRKKYKYFDGSTFQKVSVSATLPWYFSPLLFLFLFLPATSLFVSISLGLRQGKDESIPLDTRREQYKNWVSAGSVIGICGHVPVFLVLYGTGMLSTMSELWTGSATLSSAAGLVMLFSVQANLFLTKKVEKDEAALMGTNYSLMKAQAEYKKQIMRPYMFVATGVMIVGFIGFVYCVDRLRQFSQAVLILLVPVLFVLVFMGPWEQHMRKKKPFIFEAGSSEENNPS